MATQRFPQMVTDGNGGAVIVWEDWRTTPRRVYAQHVGVDGNVTWATDGIPISSLSADAPRVVRSDDGAYIIVWVSPNARLRAQKINAAGSLLWPPDTETTGVVVGTIYGPDFDIAFDGTSGLIAAWSVGGDIYANRIFAGTISGRVTDTLGAGIKGLRVALHEPGHKLLSDVLTDVAGNYVFEPVFIGDYKVKFRGCWMGYKSQWYDGRSDFGLSDNISLIAPDSPSGIDATLDKWAFEFQDAGAGYWAKRFIDTLACEEVTSGCSLSPSLYCPEEYVTRAQMAVFVLKTLDQEPSNDCLGTIFYDVNAGMTGGEAFCRYIEKFWELNITAGCGYGSYCPDDTVTRAEMAAFLTKALAQLPASTCSGTLFDDVNSTMTGGEIFCRYIEKFKELNITAGCEKRNYCPDDPVTRAQMAVFLTKGFLQ